MMRIAFVLPCAEREKRIVVERKEVKLRHK